jgi:hypothetical protein
MIDSRQIATEDRRRVPHSPVMCGQKDRTM